VSPAPTIKTVLFATEYHAPFAPGGAEWSNAAWAAGLVRRGCRVVVVTPNYGAAAHEERDGVTVRRVPVMLPVRLAPGSREAGWLVHRNPIFHRSFARQVARVAHLEHADLIHAQDEGVLVAAWRAGRARALPVVLTMRDVGLLCPLGMCTLFEPWTTFDCTTAQYVGKCVPYFLEHYVPGAQGLRRAALRARLRLGWRDQRQRHRALRGINGLIGISRGILTLLPERLAPMSRRCVVHSPPPPGPPPDAAAAVRVRAKLGIPAGPLLLYAGKRSLGKGTPVLLEALDSIRTAVPGVRFVFAGKGDLPLPAAADVHALGSLEQPDLFALYGAADVVVSPSVWPEPFSRVILEAMWAGRPVVGTAVGGTPEQIEDGVSGLLVPRGDVRALSAAVAALLGDPERRARMGAAAAARVSARFSEERVIASLLEAYETLAAPRPA
jgi:glycosyltransferase involved in cell wall biosynthesis